MVTDKAMGAPQREEYTAIVASIFGQIRRDLATARHIGEGDIDRIIDGEITLIFNTTEGWQSLKDSQSIRASALNAKVPYFTTAAASVAAAEGIAALRGSQLEVRSLQAYYS